MSELKKFSDSTLAELEKDRRKRYYVYCLVDTRDASIFYIGKGYGNRAFAHEKYALGESTYNEVDEDNESDQQLKVAKIREIASSGNEVEKIILSYGLTENEAFSSENTLINFIRLTSDIDLTNLVKGHGSSGMSVEVLERTFGYEPLLLEEISTDELILAVKVNDSFRLSRDEDKHYSFGNRDDHNLKSRTLGTWKIGKDKINRLKYIVGVNSGANNSVVSAYEIDWLKTETGLDAKGNLRYSFYSDSKSKLLLQELGLYKKCLPGLKFGSGAEKAYINHVKYV